MVRRRLAGPRLVGRCLAALVLLAAPGAVRSVGQTVLLDFTSPTCGPCRRMRPTVRRLAASGVTVREVDVSREPQMSSQWRVDSVPTFIVTVDGHERARLTGATTANVLVEMIAKSEQIAAARRASVRGQSPDQLANIQLGGAPEAFAPGDLQLPQAGRIVELQPPSGDIAPASRSAQPSASNPFSDVAAAGPQDPYVAATPAPNPAAAPAPGSAYPDTAKVTAATVRLMVEDSKGKSTGTGTIVDARSGEALILTCGHIFRESQGRGRIEVTLFDGGPQGAVKRGVSPGRLIDYDLERDLALVSIWINAPVQVAPIAPATAAARPTEPVTTMGCSNGADPTPQRTRVASVDRYNGPPNVQVAGAPVEGRSGGGLFNAAGQVVGVCFAADPQGNEGLYAGLPSIHAKLDELNLSAVYQQPSIGGANAAAVATRPADPQVRGQDPAADWPAHATPQPSAPLALPATPSHFANGANAASDGDLGTSSPAPSPGSLSAVEQATLEELAKRGASSEVICIIRPRQPGGKSEVITVSGASPAFVDALQQAASATAPTRR